jgi:hypothetical protein
LDQNRSLGIIQLFNNGLCATTLGREINRPGWARAGLLLGLDWRDKRKEGSSKRQWSVSCLEFYHHQFYFQGIKNPTEGGSGGVIFVRGWLGSVGKGVTGTLPSPNSERFPLKA